MKQVIIRDDDISFFSHPDMLETVYGRLWANEVPVCLSVIPAHSSSVKVQQYEYEQTQYVKRPQISKGLYKLLYRYDLWKRRLLSRYGKFWQRNWHYDYNIHPEYAGNNEQYAVTNNKNLCKYLNAKISDGNIEICLHGYSHKYLEFGTRSEQIITQKLLEGKRILKCAFPQATIQTFIAPYDFLSDVAVAKVLNLSFNLCTRSDVLARASFSQGRDFLKGQYISDTHPYSAYKFNKETKIFICDEYMFNDINSSQECLTRAKLRLDNVTGEFSPLIIVANHYWNFYKNWKTPDKNLLEKWNDFVDEILSREDVRVTTFSQMTV